MKKNIILGTIGILILAAMLISFSHFKNRKPINTTKNIVPEQKSKNRKNTNGQATVVWNRKETFTETQGDYEFLVRIYEGNKELIENKEFLLKMLQASVVLEYNGKRWHNLHPLVARFFREQKLIG